MVPRIGSSIAKAQDGSYRVSRYFKGSPHAKKTGFHPVEMNGTEYIFNFLPGVSVTDPLINIHSYLFNPVDAHRFVHTISQDRGLFEVVGEDHLGMRIVPVTDHEEIFRFLEHEARRLTDVDMVRKEQELYEASRK